MATFKEWWGGRVDDIEDAPRTEGANYNKTTHRWAWDAALANQWQPIETAPKDGTFVDLWCKCWKAHNDSWMFQRFAFCYWSKHEYIDNARPEWVNLSNGWCPTHWMPLPAPPKED